MFYYSLLNYVNKHHIKQYHFRDMLGKIDQQINPKMQLKPIFI